MGWWAFLHGAELGCMEAALWEQAMPGDAQLPAARCPSPKPHVCLSCVCAYELSFHLREELFLEALIKRRRWLGAWLSS